MMLAEKKAPQQVSAAMLIPFRRERARALRVLALAAITKKKVYSSKGTLTMGGGLRDFVW